MGEGRKEKGEKTEEVEVGLSGRHSLRWLTSSIPKRDEKISSRGRQERENERKKC